MISIAEAISDLLFVRDTVVVPGLGAFVKKPVSAKVNPVANHFAMPSSTLSFDANLREDNDLVINYLSEKNEIPVDEARRVLVMFVSDCFNSLKEGNKVLLKGIGSLSFDWAGDLVFEPTDALNYNSDAFGLCDITPEPVLRYKTKEEIKEEINQQQKDKNTPITVDEKAVHEQREDEDDKEDEKSGRRLGWLWVLLGLLLLAIIGFGLQYFKVVDFSQWMKQTEEQPEYEPWRVTVPTTYWSWEFYEVESEVGDTLVQREEEVVPVSMEPEKEETSAPAELSHEANIRIIAGCFGQEDNAARLTNTLKDKGYAGAFYELRGKMWYVSFGLYGTDEEASAALREIRSNTEYKAWILK